MTVKEVQDIETIEQIIDEMNLFDDDLMSMVFDGNIPATELLLKIILKRDDIIVISVASQREFKNPIVGGRDIRLDILAKDSKGKHYDIEVQKSRKLVPRDQRMDAGPCLVDPGNIGTTDSCRFYFNQYLFLSWGRRQNLLQTQIINIM